MANEKGFKAANRPAACTKPPWAAYIEPDNREEVLRKIKQECIEIYDHSFDECPKRLVCFSKTCLGRPVPSKSPTAKPYIDKMKLNQNFNSKEELVLTNCDLCPIYKNCTSTCAQVNDFMNRDKIAEPELVYKQTLDNIEVAEVKDVLPKLLGENIVIPWDVLNKTRKEVIKKYLYEQKDFLTISKELALTDQSRIRYEFYSGLNILSEYGTVRRFLEEKGDSLTKLQQDILRMVYVANLSIVQTAKVLETSKQSVQQVISRVVKNHNIKWKTFVKKHKGKLIYAVPEILK